MRCTINCKAVESDIQGVTSQHLIFMNIRFVLQKKTRLVDFGPWDLTTTVIVFYRLNYHNKHRALNRAL